MATIKDVALRAGISVTTVSRVMNDTAPVNALTKEKILKAMEELNYSPSLIAQGMRTKKSRTVGIIIPDYENYFYSELLKGLQHVIKKAGYGVLIVPNGEDAADDIKCINDLLNRNIDGIIVFTYKGDKETIDHFMKVPKNVPVIFMDNLELEDPINIVYTDGYTGVKELTNYLIGKGHRKIAFIKPLKKYSVANDRYHGYKDALMEAGIEFNEKLVFEGNYRIESGYEAAKYLLSEESIRPTAIVAATDMMALGAINYIKSKELKIPEDIAVAGFDDIYFSRLISPPLTTYKQPIDRISEEVMKIFLHKVKHPNARNRKVLIEGTLIIRRSTDINMPKTENL